MVCLGNTLRHPGHLHGAGDVTSTCKTLAEAGLGMGRDTPGHLEQHCTPRGCTISPRISPISDNKTSHLMPLLVGCQSLIKERGQQHSVLESHPISMTLFWPLLVILHQSSQKFLHWSSVLWHPASAAHWELAQPVPPSSQSRRQGAGQALSAGARAVLGTLGAHGMQPQPAWQEKREVWCWATGLCKEHWDKWSSNQ